MLRKKVFLFCVCIGTLVLSACAAVTELQLIADGATHLNEAQVTAHLSGKTERWPYYAIYYAPDGTVEGLFDKVRAKGTWKVSPDGKVCLMIPKWKDYCFSYVNNHGAITRIENGLSVGVKEVVDGKNISR